jgi:hypothetical protein
MIKLIIHLYLIKTLYIISFSPYFKAIYYKLIIWLLIFILFIIKLIIINNIRYYFMLYNILIN